MNRPLVSVVIPTYNRKKMAERLIKSLLESTYRNFEIIVVDDASPDKTSEYLKSKFKNNKTIKIFKNKKNLFAAGSKNEGQKHAKGSLFIFIDDDNVVDRRMIEELVEVFIENDKVGEAGPINFNFNNKKSILLVQSTRNMWTTKTLHLRSLKQFNSRKIWETDDIPNAFMVRASVIRENKINFKSKFVIMYEESDYAYRIRRAGYRIVMVRSAKIFHDIEESSKTKKKKDYLYHFMEDDRRPFVFARNRIIFHSLYSTKIQNLAIYSFWIWAFSAYYIFKFLTYNGFGDFSLWKKIHAAFNYFKGTINGFWIIGISGEKM